jgi:hypothetical protein
MFVAQSQTQVLAVSDATEAWLEGGEPRWNLKDSAAFKEGDAKIFLDIGTTAASLRTARRAQHLELKGWTGICAVPLPGDFGERTCRQFVLPLGGKDKESVTVPDCSESSAAGVSESVRGLLGQSTDTSTCPKVTLPAVGIATFLKQISAPPVMDYVSVITEEAETPIVKSILSNFPFHEICVRAWVVSHNDEIGMEAFVRNLLEVGHGCRVREGVGEYWARCNCKGGAQGESTPGAGFLQLAQSAARET